MSSPDELYRSGDLAGAIAAATEVVKKSPTDAAARGLLCELLCVAGEYERADKQLDAVSKLTPETAVRASLLRHHVRAAIARHEVYEKGRVPEFLDRPDGALEKRVQALVELRDGAFAAAATCIAQANDVEGEIAATVDGTAPTDFRDLDDLLGPTLEVYTATGKYYWIHASQMRSLEFDPVGSVIDTAWRNASIETVGELRGRVAIPVSYARTSSSDDAALLLARATDWIETAENGPVLGIGQREFLVGEDSAPMLSLGSIEWAAS